MYSASDQKELKKTWNRPTCRQAGRSERVASVGEQNGGLGGISPTLQILGEICPKICYYIYEGLDKHPY